MEKVSSVTLFAGLGCFAIAGVVTGCRTPSAKERIEAVLPA